MWVSVSNPIGMVCRLFSSQSIIARGFRTKHGNCCPFGLIGLPSCNGIPLKRNHPFFGNTGWNHLRMGTGWAYVRFGHSKWVKSFRRSHPGMIFRYVHQPIHSPIRCHYPSLDGRKQTSSANSAAIPDRISAKSNPICFVQLFASPGRYPSRQSHFRRSGSYQRVSSAPLQ
jgi:hypothetical protein